jgi:predicted pyridoxine 5'-phosphate oxidase superfamily flavin-nucleotide-binding protein
VGKIHPEIDDRLRSFLEAQHLFFVATAPSSTDGHVNCSPKGLDAFRVLDPRTVAYVDFVGSGVETIAHVRENGRIVLMFCAFDGPPKIVRLHGRGSVVEPSDREFAGLAGRFAHDPRLAVRAILRVSITRISDSCGYAVPLYDHRGPRDQLPAWTERKGSAGIEAYKRDKNSTSIDGLVGLGRPAAEHPVAAGAPPAALRPRRRTRAR